MKIFLVFGFLLLFVSFADAQQNPFLSQPSQEQKDDTTEKNITTQKRTSQKKISINNIGTVRYLSHKIVRAQASMRRDLEMLFTGEKGESAPLTLFLLALLSFAYGVVHAAGPGHGKVFIGSYMIAGKSKYIDSVKAAITIVTAHTISAVIVISVIFLIFGTITMRTTASVEEYIQTFSAILICAIGLFLFVNNLLKALGKKSIGACNHSHEAKDKSLLALALSVGVIPCPGVTLLLLFAINLGRIPAGIVSVVSMALGMIVTIAVIGAIFLAAGKSAISASKSKPTIHKGIANILSVFGALIILIFGLLLLSSVL